MNTLKPHAAKNAAQRACLHICVKSVFLTVCVCFDQCYPAAMGRWGQLAGLSCSPQSERAQEETGEVPAPVSTGEQKETT